MAKQWSISRGDVHKSSYVFNKPYNAEKYRELYDLLDGVCNKFHNQDVVSTLTRKIAEEVMNIIEHNKKWNEIKVRMEFNPTGSRFKCEILYDGGEYYDPMTHEIGNVTGSTDRFKKFERKHTIASHPPKQVEIRVNIEL